MSAPLLNEDEDRRFKFMSACMGLRDLLSNRIDVEDEELMWLTEECVETVLMSVGWPLSPPWWGLD